MNHRQGRSFLTVAVLGLLSVLVVTAGSADVVTAAGTPDIVLAKSMPAEVLYGEDIPVSLTLRNPTLIDGFNASFNDTLPAGVSYVAGSSNPAARVLPQVNGTTVLIWDNVADALAGTTLNLGYSIRYNRTTFSVGQSVPNTANAYVNSDPRLAPKFDAVTGAAIATSFTGSSIGATAQTKLVPFRLTKDEPSEESELLRGVHEHQTAYTLTVDNNLVNPTNNFSIVDFVPSGLEFLGCGTVDNSAPGEEYPGSGRINPGNAPTLTNPCPTPSSVSTVTLDPDGVGPLPNDVYTRVQWNSAALAASIGSADLAPNSSFKISYVAAIPLRKNVQAVLAAPTANLDNNTGDFTTETSGEQTLTNYGVASGFYNGSPTASTDDDYEDVFAEDISIHKRVDNPNFEQDTTPTFTLFVESSEYALSTDPIVVTDTLPAMLDYEPSSPAPTTPIVVDNSTNPLVLTWNLPAFSAANSTATITLNTRVRDTYRGTSNPVASSDDFTNDVSLATTSTTITSNAGTTTAIPVNDVSSAGLTASGPSIAKDVALPMPGPISGCGDGAGLSWNADVARTYRPGDIVCFKLEARFPGMLDTLNPVVDDFLPAGFAYVSTALGAQNTIDVAGVTVSYDATANRVTYSLANVDIGGKLLQGIVTTRIVDPNAAKPGDLLGNLMKFRYSNTAGAVFQLREDASVEWSEPILTLDKSVATVNGVAPTSNPAIVREGDRVVYRVAVTNTGTADAFDVSVRDVLPAQIQCANVSLITNGGACDTAPTPDRIQWDQDDNIDIAAGATATLTYEVLVPAGVTPGITLTNRAGVRDYRGLTNTSTPFTYVPANNIDSTLTPNTTAADDTAAIFTELPTVVKIRSTEINQSGNNTASQATIGERISYTVTVNVPPGTTVTNARITDVLDAEKDLVASSVVATRNGVALPNAGFTISVDDAGNRFTVTAPDPYVVPPGPTGDSIVIAFDAIVTNVASNTRGTTTGNTVNLAYNNALGPQTISASVNTTIVEPNIDLTKRNDDADGVVAPGQTITYSLDVLNRNQTVGPPSVAIAGVSTANDTVVTDVVPAELIVLEASGDPAEDGDTIAPNGGTWDAASRTITWTIPTINPGATTTRSYQVQTADPLVAAGAMINNAEARTTSFPGTPTGPAIERASTTSFGGPGSGYQDPAQSTVTAPVLSATKTGTPDVATVGATVTYTVTATVPAGVIAADVTVLDTLPVGTTYESLTSVTCLQGVGACSPNLNAASVTTSGQNLSFFLGDLTTPAVGDRTVAITYVAYVANVPAADAGATLRNGAAIYWNATNKITGNPTTPPAAGTFDRSSLPSFDDVATVEPRLTIDKDVRGQVADLDTRRSKPGDVLTFDVTVANAGSGPAYDIIVSDSPDPRLTGYSFTPVTGVVNSDSTPTDGTLEWTIAGPIAAGSSVTITYSLTVPASWNSAEENPVGPELTNTADVPSYFALPQSVRSANPTRSFRNYDNVTADVVTIELDLASIGDLVWFDVDGDGVRDAAEPPIANVDVIVTYLGANGVAGGGDDETFTTQTDANGRYLVDRLPGGNYTVDVLESDPQFIAGLVPSYDQDGGTVSPNGVWAGTLGQAEDRRDVDFGYTGTGSIGDTIWFDRNGNGTKDVGEAGLAGVPVTVTWFGPDGVAGGIDDIAYSTATDAAGNYLVSRLPAGNFSVVVDATALAAAGYVNVTDPNGGNDNRSLVTLAAAQNNLAQDFGYRGAGMIGDRIWLDGDGDGSQDVGEQGLVGVTVQLVSFGPDGVAGGSDDSTFTTVTGADGSYLFNFLPRGEYRVTVQGGLPGGVTNSGDPDGGANSTSRVTLTVGAPDNLTQDFGYDAQSVLGDRVWWDLDRDGVQDLGEPGIGGVAVRATGPNGLVLNTTTDAAGNYLFTDLPDGPWTVAVVSGVPTGFGQTFDADGLGTPGTSATTLATSDLLQDFGYAGTGSIGDRVWLDRDGDGVQDLGEPGIEDTTVELTWYGPDGTLGGGDDVVLTKTTDANGNYQFVGLPAGNFSVRVVTTDPDFPSGVSPTFDRDGTTITPNGITPVALTTGQAVTDVDFGYRGGGSIGDTIWFDRNGDGAITANEPGIAGVDVTLLWFGEDGVLGGADDETFTTTTDAAGNYLFSGLPPGEYRVTVDTADLPAGMAATFDADGGLDSTSRLALADGAVNLLQDFGYRGAASIGDTVYLDLDGNGAQGPGEPGVPGQTVELTWQSPSGPVTFTTTTNATGGYLFANLPDGSYQVRVVGGIAAVASNTADPDGASDSTSAVTLAGGVSNLAQDFGYQGNNTIGDRIWWDQNADGVFDAFEPGLANVTLTAIWFGPDGVAGGGDDITLPSTVTDNTGTYQFAGLPDGNYSVAVTGGLPSGLTANTYDRDNGTTNPNGTSIVTGLGVGTSAPTSDLEQDFGYAGTGSIGDTIWLDLDGDGTLDTAEPGIAGAVITLTWSGTDGTLGTADDVVYPPQATSATGRYLFEHLPAGPFRVDVTNLPAGVSNTADPDGNADNTAQLTLAASQNNLAQDFAYRGTATVGDTIWLDVDGDKVQGPNEPGLPGITVTVTSQGADGTLGTADDVIVTVVTDVDGRYLVTGLPPGGTMVSYRTSDLGAALEPNSDLDGGDLTTAAVVLNNGDDVRTLDFGVVGSSTVSGVVWKDTNGDGTRDAGEVGVPGVTVIVTWAGPKGPIDLTVITGPNGDWALSRVPAGDYSVRTVASTYPPGLSLSTAAVATVNVPPGGTGRVVHALTPNGAVGDRVWSDTNRNGVQDPGESGVPGVRINLRNPAGNVVASVVTDPNGNYRFADLPPGTYTVEVDTATLPSGSAIVFDPDGSNDGRFIVVVGPGDDITTVDFGVAPATPGLGTLPATGATIVRILTVALSLVAFGWLLFGTSRRRSRVRT